MLIGGNRVICMGCVCLFRFCKLSASILCRRNGQRCLTATLFFNHAMPLLFFQSCGFGHCGERGSLSNPSSMARCSKWLAEVPCFGRACISTGPSFRPKESAQGTRRRDGGRGGREEPRAAAPLEGRDAPPQVPLVVSAGWVARRVDRNGRLQF